MIFFFEKCVVKIILCLHHLTCLSVHIYLLIILKCSLITRVRARATLLTTNKNLHQPMRWLSFGLVGRQPFLITLLHAFSLSFLSVTLFFIFPSSRRNRGAARARDIFIPRIRISVPLFSFFSFRDTKRRRMNFENVRESTRRSNRSGYTILQFSRTLAPMFPRDPVM